MPEVETKIDQLQDAGNKVEPAVDYFRHVEKRSGERVEFDVNKIRNAIFQAAHSVGGEDRERADELAHKVCRYMRELRGEHVPKVEEIQDAVEKILIKNGHARTAKAFILYREKRARQRRGTNREGIKKALAGRKEATDLALFVQTTGETIASWDRTRISRALVRETNLDAAEADKIALEVEGVVINSGVKEVTSSLIRELVNSKLVERGLVEHYKRHARLGVPAYDVERMMLFKNRENANVPHNPEATNMTIAEWTLKQFALSMVFDSDVADAHTRGDIHLHDLGFINRPYCSGQSLEYVKKFGLSLPNALSMANPAKHPETLLAHMVKFSAALQGHFAGAIGWDAVNLFFAPFTEGMNDHDLHQLAQILIFEYSQQNVARGGQAIFSDINLYWEVPAHFEGVEAIGPGGEYTGRKYGDYMKEAQRFVWAIFDVYKEGDAKGRPFFFPKPLVHITERFFATPGWQDFLWHISDVAVEKGNTYFVFDRGNTAKISECCRLSFKLEASDLRDALTPWKMRYCALQNVTLNLPRAAYVANHNDEKLFERLRRDIELTAKAHIQKKVFIDKLLALKDEGPLALLTMKQDGEEYLRMKRVTYLVGVLGLNELVQYHLGHELHEDETAFRFGLKVMAFLNLECRRLSQQYDMRFVLEQTPAESTAYRLARLDLGHYRDSTLQVVKGNIEDGSAYYTNSTYLNVGHPIDPIDRVYREGKFHDMIDAGALTHVWLADARPPKEAIANFVLKTFHHTRNAQIAFSPEFTTCKACGRTSRGLNDICPYCSSSEVDFITRVTGYFSTVSSWNVGKRAELLDRYKDGFKPVG